VLGVQATGQGPTTKRAEPGENEAAQNREGDRAHRSKDSELLINVDTYRR
jgi:hypothetical protein